MIYISVELIKSKKSKVLIISRNIKLKKLHKKRDLVKKCQELRLNSSILSKFKKQ